MSVTNRARVRVMKSAYLILASRLDSDTYTVSVTTDINKAHAFTPEGALREVNRLGEFLPELGPVAEFV
jgi:hypothetical protein